MWNCVQIKVNISNIYLLKRKEKKKNTFIQFLNQKKKTYEMRNTKY